MSSGATVLRRIPDSDGVQQLLNHMIEEDADRRAQESAGYLRDDRSGGYAAPTGPATGTTQGTRTRAPSPRP